MSLTRTLLIDLPVFKIGIFKRGHYLCKFVAGLVID